MASFADADISHFGKSFPSSELHDFSSELLGDRNDRVKWSDCRDLVEVPGEPEWKLRCLAEAFPQYCWKYPEPEVIIHYHYNLATTADAPAGQSTAALPVFYAHLPNSFSPYDFSIQPKSLDRAREQLYHKIQAVYSSENEFMVLGDQMCAGAACVVQVGNLKWLRAKILKFYKGSNVVVDLVDIGNENIVRMENVRPLLKVFGRLPPLALRCRMKDVDMNDLTMEKVDMFQRLIESCGNIVRVELADVSCIPFLVNLYHPTMQGKNLGELFYHREVQTEYKKTQKKRWNEKLNFSSDCTDEENSEDEHSEPSHILHLERLQKPITDEPLYISHVENSRFIYLHSRYHKKTIEKLERNLFIKWSELKNVPERWLIPAIACAYSDFSTDNPCRVIVAEIRDKMVWLRSADHGWKKRVSKLDCLSGTLRLLTREFSEVPLMYLCRLPSSMQHYPHQSETDILRNILPVGAVVTIRRYRSKRTLPHKVDIFMENNESVIDVLERLKVEKRVIHPCLDLVPYKSSAYIQLYKLDSDYQEDVEVFQPFAKGRLEYSNL
uniref:Tudor domain-containing protein n=1 Tax=Setaria digitata TaxID=48799 RepID=A0A915Q5P7_9BILA